MTHLKQVHTSYHLLADNIRYTNTVNLPSEMIEFGKYTLEYVPPDGSPTDHSIKMSISSEATVTQMLEFFTSFLKASGYYIDENKELVFERSAPDFSDVPDKWWHSGAGYADGNWGGLAPRGTEGSIATKTESSQEFWEDDGFSQTGNPGVIGGDTVYIGSGLPGGMGNDVITF